MSNEKIKIIAEIGLAHDASLGNAHAYIDAVAKTGVDGIKFQTHIAHAESITTEPWRVKFSFQDKSRYDYWKRMEFSEAQWLGLKEHADEVGLLFLSTPFSIEAFEMLRRVGVHAWKIASGEITNYPLIEKVANTQQPVWVSTGMSGENEINSVVKILNNFDSDFTIFQCTSKYPTKPEEVGLNILHDIKNKYNCEVGLSDHSGTIYPSLAAATIGVNVLEVHVVFDKSMFGPDVSSSITINELSQLVEGVRYIEKMIKNPVDKNDMETDMDQMRNLFMKRIVTKTSVRKNELLTLNNLTTKKSDLGIPAMEWPSIINSKSGRDLPAGYFLTQEDIIKNN
tara:strand:+ start:961 stop:1980 length:1020 start_codon:yes stop_codon:yes gene_type:complete